MQLIRRSHLLAAALIAVLGVLALSPPASAEHVQCGDVITQDTTLDSDVVCSQLGENGFGLGIGADDITLDLNGFAVLSSTGSSDETLGIVSTRHPVRNVVLRDGAVEGFGGGIALYGTRVHIQNVLAGSISLTGDGNRVTESFTGHLFVAGANDRVIGNVIASAGSDTPSSLVVVNFKNVIVRGNRFAHVLGSPVRLANGRGAVIAGNTFTVGYDALVAIQTSGEVSKLRLIGNVVECVGPVACSEL